MRQPGAAGGQAGWPHPLPLTLAGECPPDPCETRLETWTLLKEGQEVFLRGRFIQSPAYPSLVFRLSCQSLICFVVTKASKLLSACAKTREERLKPLTTPYPLPDGLRGGKGI